MRIWLSLVFFIISIVIVFFMQHEGIYTTIDYISGLGSVASIYAILLAFIEFRSAKKVAKETKNAIESKIGEINHLLSYADLEKHIEYCSSISLYLKSGQYVAVAIRLEELKKVLLEVKNNQSIKDKNEFKIQQMVMRLGSDITAVGNKWKNVTELDSSMVLEHMNEVSTFLQDISTKIKYQTI